MLKDIKESVEGGQTLAEALQNLPSSSMISLSTWWPLGKRAVS